jgi:flagellar hook assembly protein FlgD
LIADLNEAPVGLGDEGVFHLSPGQPNPFRSEVRFAVTLPARGNLEVAVFDLSGRRVASIHRGSATAGRHEFGWDGRTLNGNRARGGIYFLSATASGQTLSRKVILVGGP